MQSGSSSCVPLLQRRGPTHSLSLTLCASSLPLLCLFRLLSPFLIFFFFILAIALLCFFFGPLLSHSFQRCLSTSPAFLFPLLLCSVFPLDSRVQVLSFSPSLLLFTAHHF